MDLGANWSRNRTRINELSEGVEFHTFWTDGRGGARTYVGEEIGDLYDSKLVTVEDPSSPYNGYPILDKNGSWQAVRINNSRNKIGNFNPDFSMGIQSSLRYKKWTMHLAADLRFGGKFMSQTYRYFESNLTTQRFLDQLINPNGLTGESLRNYLIENDLVRVQGNRYPIVGGPGDEYGAILSMWVEMLETSAYSIQELLLNTMLRVISKDIRKISEVRGQSISLIQTIILGIL